MLMDLMTHVHNLQNAKSATHPIAPHAGNVRALLRLAHASAPRCRAYPHCLPGAHSGAFNQDF